LTEEDPELVPVVGFGDIRKGATTEGLDGVMFLNGSGEDNDGEQRIHFLQSAEDREAAQVRQSQIQDDCPEGVLFGFLQRLLSRCHAADGVPLVLKVIVERQREIRIVLNDEDGRTMGRELLSVHELTN